jgi:hypothetical protein
MGMEEQEVLAALGKVVMESAFMEWLVALLVAAVEGKSRDYAEDLCKQPGVAMRALQEASGSDHSLLRLYEDADALRKHRNLLAHSVAMVGMDVRHNKVCLYWHPKTDKEERLYPCDLLGIAREIEAMCARLHREAQERSQDVRSSRAINQTWRLIHAIR